jgi:polyisoprenoid-binding protein YceI
VNAKAARYCLPFLLAVSAAATAQQKTFTLDPARSTVDFTLNGNFHTVHGSFRFKGGAITFDPNGAASGQLVVDAATGESGNDSRDHKMKHEILETDRYPDVVLTVEKIEGAISAAGVSTVRMHGTFLLHGQKHPVDIPAEINVSGEQARATGELVVPYVDWGLKNPSTFIFRVSKEVSLHITAVGRLAAQ